MGNIEGKKGANEALKMVFEVKSVYGRLLYYPKNALATHFVNVFGRRGHQSKTTLVEAEIKLLIELGVNIELTSQPEEPLHKRKPK